MTICHLTTGLPASGKTTHARTLDAFRFNLDDYRKMLWGESEWTHDKEHVAVSALIAGVRSAVAAGHDVVIDNTHLTPGLPKQYRKELSSMGVEFRVHDFTGVDIEECKRRDDERTDGYVGEIVIDRLAHNHAKARKNGWRLTDKWMNSTPKFTPEPYEMRPDLPQVVLCDIDGTVAVHGDERGHYDYDKVSTDVPNDGIIRVVQALAENYEVIFVSGREDRCREDTEEWLWKNNLSDGENKLLMRLTGDHRPDYIIKSELFDAHIRNKYDVLAVFDDRNQVVTQCWRAMGLPTLQVAPGDF